MFLNEAVLCRALTGVCGKLPPMMLINNESKMVNGPLRKQHIAMAGVWQFCLNHYVISQVLTEAGKDPASGPLPHIQ